MSLKLFYLTAEISPFANTSHLADYSVNVPLALQDLGHDIRTIIPKYGFVSERKYILREVIRLREIPFEFDDEEVFTSAKSAFIPKTRVQVYFLENDSRFKTLPNLLYKSKNGRIIADNAERFAYFSKASIATLPHLFWKPDILICNDWQTAMTPMIYKQLYDSKEFYDNIKTVLTIHSIDEYVNFNRKAFELAGVKLPASVKKDDINIYELAAPFADLIITIDTPESNTYDDFLKIKGISSLKNNIIKASIEDLDNPDYSSISNIINENLLKKFK